MAEKFYVLAPEHLHGPYDTEEEARAYAESRGGLDVAVSVPPPDDGAPVRVAGLRVLGTIPRIDCKVSVGSVPQSSEDT